MKPFLFPKTAAVKDDTPRPLTDEDIEKLRELDRARFDPERDTPIVAAKIVSLVDKYGKKYEPREKRVKKQHPGGLPDVVPGTVDWKKQESIGKKPLGEGGRKKKPSGKK